ncbi:MAG TPA: DUF255 domain-containing protein [Nitrospirota bacterium]|nr:DUF255 domain-containing protein [Nitrospirota bacterium]
MKRIINAVFAVLLCSQMTMASDFRFSPRPNKANLIQWRNWGQDAFDEAKRTNKLILLSLSAVWCHWCHVMDETTYSDPGVIGFINGNFIPVRVDADLRPDIDSLYNQGGWPSTAILTPEGEVISGGNYFPPEEMLGRLRRASILMRSDPAAVEGRIEELKTLEELRASRQEAFTGLPDKSTLDDILKQIKSSFDDMNGGFGRGQKFPSPDTIDFLLSIYTRQKDREALRIVSTTLDHMAQGELFDKTEGGFFRYATMPDWSEPHYEKMLDVNAGMIRNYANAALATGKKEYLRIVDETIRYVQANLSDAITGAFYGSQDADESYYRSKNRSKLTAPAVDKTVYTDSSSLMVSALVSAYEATGRNAYLALAKKSGDFILENLSAGDNGVFHDLRDRTPVLKGMLSDNALFGSALLDLYNATGEKKYLHRAKQIGRLLIDRFYDADSKRFRISSDPSLKKPVTAGMLAEVNNNLASYRALRFLSRLAYAGDAPRFREIRNAAAETLKNEYHRYAPYAASYGNVVLWITGDPMVITIIAGEQRVNAYLSAMTEVSVPEKVVRVFSLPADGKTISKLGYSLQEAVYLCAGKRCAAPIGNPETLKRELKDFAGGPSQDRK